MAPDNPKAWRALVDFLETGNDNNALAAALLKCVEIAESKGNFGRSRPLRIRLSEVREAAGDKRAALAALKEFTSNPVAVAAVNLPAAAADPKNKLAGAKAPALSAAIAAEEAVRDADNATMKQRSTNLFMDINADLVPDAAPAPAPAPITPIRPKPVASPPKPAAATTVAAVAKAAAEAAAAGPKLSSWIKAATNATGKAKTPSVEEVAVMSDSERLEALEEYCTSLEETSDPLFRRSRAVAVAQSIAASGAEAPWLEARLRELLGEDGTSAAREGALLAIHALCEVAGAAGEPYGVSLLPLVLQSNGDQSAVVRTAAADAGAALARSLNPHAVRLVLPAITEAVESSTWRIKAGALEVMATLAECSPVQVALALPEIVPVVSHQVWDTKREVQAASKHALLAACACIGNPDIEPLVRPISHE